MNRDDRILFVACLIGSLSAIIIEMYILMVHALFIRELSRLDQLAVGAGVPWVIGCATIILVGTALDKVLKKE